MKEKIKKIIENSGLIVLDTNVYLNIYDCSPEFSNFSLKVLNSIKNSIILPCTVKREFFKNHFECFNRQRKRVDTACKRIDSQLKSTKDKINNCCQIIKDFEFPDIDNLGQSLINKINEAMDIVKNYSIEHNVLEFVNNISIQNDAVGELINWLIENDKLLPDFSVDEIYMMTLAADKRYNQEIPPGFKDKKDGEGLGRYGDYFIWKQTLDVAKDRNVDIIFVTDDLKIDWYERTNDKLSFHNKLNEEFSNIVGTDFVGITSKEFLSIVAEINGIKKTSAIEQVLEYTTDDYIKHLVNNDIIYDHLNELSYSPDKFVDMSSLSQVSDIKLELNNDAGAKYLKYEIKEINNNYAIYNLLYNLEVEFVSYEYLGHEDNEEIYSNGRIHKLQGEVVLEVTRESNGYLVPDYELYSAKLISGDLKEYEAYDVEEVCLKCGNEFGKYRCYDGTPICEKCMQNDSYGVICTFCGRKIPLKYMCTDNSCIECAQQNDIV